MEKLASETVPWRGAEVDQPCKSRRPIPLLNGLGSGLEGITDRDPGDHDPEPMGDVAIAESSIGYLVRDVHRAFSRALQARIAAHGVSMGQWFFLRALWEEDGLTQRELSQRVGMMEPTTVTALNSMERRGFVERVRNAHDRRKVNIFLTPKGRALREVLLPCSAQVNSQATHGVDDQDLARALAVLLSVARNLSSSLPADAALADGAHGLL